MSGETKAAFIVGGLITALRLFWYGGSWLSYWRRTRALKRLTWRERCAREGYSGAEYAKRIGRSGF
jgi:hypothetical protein